MIGRLSGRVDWKGADQVLIDVGGVGYVVHVSDRTLAALPAPGGFAALYTDLLVREDLLQLYGFLSLQEKEWHRLLTSVQGIGAKASLAILGALGPEGVSRAIAVGDWVAVKAAPGVGPKLAQRVVNELKGRAAEVIAMGSTPESPAVAGTGAPHPSSAPPAPVVASGIASGQADALSALINLGYGQSEAAAAVAQAGGEGAEGADRLIRDALKLLAPKA